MKDNKFMSFYSYNTPYFLFLSNKKLKCTFKFSNKIYSASFHKSTKTHKQLKGKPYSLF